MKTIKTYTYFNQRRYSAPWVAKMTASGKYDFSEEVGTYTGNARLGEGGDLVIFDPVEGQVYGYGQKDYRASSKSEKAFVKCINGELVPCDKLGREA